jgi:threonine/homoserine/homoserine lactone efflux protein
MLVALILFCFVASITPGPNNMMLLSSGATFGFRRSIPHMLGISAGCMLMVLIVGWGLGGISRDLPQFHTALQIAASLYLLWLAWRIARSAGPGEAGARTKPIGVLGAAAFQWVNPKAWAMVVGAVASFSHPDSAGRDALMIAGVLFAVGLPSIMVWAAGGQMLRRFLDRPKLLRAFNGSMAALLVLSLVPGWWDLLAPSIEA